MPSVVHDRRGFYHHDQSHHDQIHHDQIHHGLNRRDLNHLDLKTHEHRNLNRRRTVLVRRDQNLNRRQIVRLNGLDHRVHVLRHHRDWNGS